MLESPGAPGAFFCSLAPEVLKPIRRKSGVANRVLEILVPRGRLAASTYHASIRQGIATVGADGGFPCADQRDPPGFPRPEARFRAGLKEIGFVEGQNLTIEYRWPERQDDRLRQIAAKLVRRQVAVIVTPGSTAAALAAAGATLSLVSAVGTRSS